MPAFLSHTLDFVALIVGVRIGLSRLIYSYEFHNNDAFNNFTYMVPSFDTPTHTLWGQQPLRRGVPNIYTEILW